MILMVLMNLYRIIFANNFSLKKVREEILNTIALGEIENITTEAVTCHAPKKLATGVGIFRGDRLLHRKKACSEWVQTRKCQTLRLLQVDTSARLS